MKITQACFVSVSVAIAIVLTSCGNGSKKFPPSPEEMVKDYEELDNGASIWNEAVQYYNDKEYSKALERLDRYLQVDGADKANAFNMRADIQYKIGNYEKGIQDATNAISIRSTDARGFLTRGNCHYKLDDNDRACDDWRRAADLGQEEAQNNLSNICD